MESASGVTLEKTMAAPGIKRFVCCLAVSASLSLVPVFAAGEPADKAPPGTPSPSPAKPVQGMSKPGEAKLDAARKAGQPLPRPPELPTELVDEVAELAMPGSPALLSMRAAVAQLARPEAAAQVAELIRSVALKPT